MDQQSSTHPAVIAAATVIGVTTCIGITWWLLFISIGRTLTGDGLVVMALVAIVVGWGMWRFLLYNQKVSRENEARIEE